MSKGTEKFPKSERGIALRGQDVGVRLPDAGSKHSGGRQQRRGFVSYGHIRAMVEGMSQRKGIQEEKKEE
jgi:hypothetical protein